MVDFLCRNYMEISYNIIQVFYVQTTVQKTALVNKQGVNVKTITILQTVQFKLNVNSTVTIAVVAKTSNAVVIQAITAAIVKEL